MKLKLPNLRNPEPPSNKLQLAYFYLSESIQKARFKMRHSVVTIFDRDARRSGPTNHFVGFSIRVYSKIYEKYKET